MRLGFSVAIYNDFDILVTDEIMGVGDMSFQKKCFEKMVDFKRQGKSMVIATQDMRTIKRFCDKAFLLEDGKILVAGGPEEVVEKYQMLLNTKKILSESSRIQMVTETKRWATDMQEWGTREGTKEVVLKDFVLLDRWGQRIHRLDLEVKLLSVFILRYMKRWIIVILAWLFLEKMECIVMGRIPSSMVWLWSRCIKEMDILN